MSTPGKRKERGSAAESGLHPPHVTENDEGAPVQRSMQAPDEVPALPANAQGKDRVEADEAPQRIRSESMYDDRPGEDKDRRETDMP